MEVCRSPRHHYQTLGCTYVWLKTLLAQRSARPDSECKVGTFILKFQPHKMHPKSLKFRFPTMSTNILMYSPHTFLLTPEVPPVISSDTREYLAPVDSSVTLRCQADGSPPPSVTWHKDGRVLSETVRLRVLSSGSLQIAFIQPSDAGRYTCTAANAAGTVSWEMSLTVQSRFPSIRSLK